MADSAYQMGKKVNTGNTGRGMRRVRKAVHSGEFCRPRLVCAERSTNLVYSVLSFALGVVVFVIVIISML